MISRVFIRFLLFFSILSYSNLSLAGYFELGLSGNYRKIFLPTESDSDAFDETQAFTGSVAYYFYEMAAIELNFTRGESTRFVPSAIADVKTTHFFSLLGSDIILTFAKRTSRFVPFVKLGIGFFLEKEVSYEYDNKVGPSIIDVVRLENTLVPSAGGGIRVRITKTLGLKFGLEVWTSDALANNPKFDWAGKAGISLFL